MESLPIACDLAALSPAERRRRAELASLLGARIVSLRELENGYSLTLDMGRETLSELIALEGRCCPFLRFRVSGAPGAEHTGLEITGGEGVKAFLAAEFALGGGGGRRD